LLIFFVFHHPCVKLKDKKRRNFCSKEFAVREHRPGRGSRSAEQRRDTPKVTQHMNNISKKSTKVSGESIQCPMHRTTHPFQSLCPSWALT